MQHYACRYVAHTDRVQSCTLLALPSLCHYFVQTLTGKSNSMRCTFFASSVFLACLAFLAAELPCPAVHAHALSGCKPVLHASILHSVTDCMQRLTLSASSAFLACSAFLAVAAATCSAFLAAAAAASSAFLAAAAALP